MLRSFEDRLLGGVCGGIATALRIPSWLVRAVFALLTVASLGIFTLFYVLLWWIVPLESYVQKRRGTLPLVFLFLLLILTIGLWVGRDMGWLRTGSGESLILPIMALCLAVTYFLRQVKV